MDLQVPILITYELSDDTVEAHALLDLASGEIRQVRYDDHDAEALGHPWLGDDYEFTSGTLSNKGKDVEFSVTVHRTTGQHSVSADELLEIKLKAAALFAGLSGPDVAKSTTGRKG